MSFAQEVKAEIIPIIPSSRHCRAASLAAILSCIGSFSREEDGSEVLTIASDNRDAIRKGFTLLQKTVNINAVLMMDGPQPGRGSRISGRLELSESEMRRLKSLLQMTGDGTVSAQLLAKPCCRRSYIRELFLCTGSVNDPRKEYHLEFSLRTQAQADELVKVLESLGPEARSVRRGRSFVVYIKEASDIVDLLNMMGAPVSMMEMENQRILKGLRGDINRRVNCETANITKAVSAAQRQMEDIRLLQREDILPTLPESLRVMAELRLEYPDLSLRELGELADPPVGKSGVNHRLRKLSEIAGRMKEQQSQ